MPQKKRKAKKTAHKPAKKTAKKKAKKTAKKRAKNTPGPVPAGWCQDFSAPHGAPVDFTAPPTGTINQSGNYWPFCGQNDTKLGPPIDFSTLNQQIYIKSSATSGQICPFTPAPCSKLETHSVTIK